MAFDNRDMRQAVPRKPHIALVKGWWRVSSYRDRQHVKRAPLGLVEAAHAFIGTLNRGRHG